MKRVLSLTLGFVASLLLIDCAGRCAAEGTVAGFLGATVCGILLLFVVITMAAVSIAWENEIERQNRRPQ